MKLCKDCKHCEPRLYHTWFGLGSIRENWERATCGAYAFADPMQVVTGEKREPVRCYVARLRDDCCGYDGKSWEPRA